MYPGRPIGLLHASVGWLVRAMSPNASKGDAQSDRRRSFIFTVRGLSPVFAAHREDAGARGLSPMVRLCCVSPEGCYTAGEH